MPLAGTTSFCLGCRTATTPGCPTINLGRAGACCVCGFQLLDAPLRNSRDSPQHTTRAARYIQQRAGGKPNHTAHPQPPSKGVNFGGWISPYFLLSASTRQALYRRYGRFFAEFLNDESLVPLGLLALSTCVGFRYGGRV